MPLLSRPAASRGSDGPEHLAEECREDDCPRFPCKLYKQGRRRGFYEGYDKGFANGYAEGFAAGLAAAGRASS